MDTAETSVVLSLLNIYLTMELDNRKLFLRLLVTKVEVDDLQFLKKNLESRNGFKQDNDGDVANLLDFQMNIKEEQDDAWTNNTEEDDEIGVDCKIEKSEEDVKTNAKEVKMFCCGHCPKSFARRNALCNITIKSF